MCVRPMAERCYHTDSKARRCGPAQSFSRLLRGVAAETNASAPNSRSATASPGRSERRGAWGARG
jgi:hypothetical protein